MVRRALRSTSLKKMQRKAPSGGTRLSYERRKPGPAKCAKCKSFLGGVVRARQSKIHKLSGTKHRPNRAYGGFLCPSCLKEQIKSKVLKD